MSTGINNLPNPGMTFSPFDPLTAEEQNQLVENIESLADGTGIGDGAVTAQKLDYATLAFGNYSTTEQDTGFKWIDGKAIYKRTFTGKITAGASAYINTTLLAPGTIDNLIDASGYLMSGSGYPTALMSWAGNSPSLWYAASGLYVNSGGALTLTSMFNSARTNQPYAITIHYTKV